MKPDDFDLWSKELQEDIRYLWKIYPTIDVSGHGYVCYATIRNPDEGVGKPVRISLGFEITLPKDWPWKKCEPFLWRLAAEFVRYKEANSV